MTDYNKEGYVKYRFLVLLIMLMISNKSFSQFDSINSIVYDIDSLVYKKVILKNGGFDTLYFDLKKQQRKIFYCIDTMPKPVKDSISFLGQILSKLKLPSYYPAHKPHEGVLSFIVEKNGSVSNLRIVKGFELSKSIEILGNLKNDFPEVIPGIRCGETVPVEVQVSFSLISYGVKRVVYDTVKISKKRNRKFLFRNRKP